MQKEAAKFKLPSGGNFFPKAEAATLSAQDKLRKLTRDEISDYAQQQTRNTTDGLFTSLGLGTAGLFSKNFKDKATKKLGDFKVKLNQTDERVTQKALDALKVKEGGHIRRFMTTNKPIPVAKTTGPSGDKMLFDIDARTPSMTAGIHNTSKVVAPLLGSMYVAEKMFPMEEQTAQIKELEMEKNAAEETLKIVLMDKQAALDKVAELKEIIQEKEYLMKLAYEETNLYKKEIRTVSMEKEAVQKQYENLEKTAAAIQSDYDELYLRTKSRERSGHAVKIAETMLETGMIKQAEFDAKVDFLMDCDNETFKLHEMISKVSNNKEKLLESSSYLIETINRNDLPLFVKGTSKTGQSIGDAARDLINKGGN